MNNTLNEIQLSYKNKVAKKPKITCSQVAREVVQNIYKEVKCEMDLKEYFFIVFLNRRNQVLGFYKLSEGGLTATVTDIRIVFAAALKCLASTIIMAHNHPSGNPEPSQADIDLTKQFKKAGDILSIKVLDHIIVTSDEEVYTSFVDELLL
ncbi:MAG: JAB domain-containing protein [Crocinitomicaceae bacterium]|nr:JAB domain-containing protein [Crocinitomicaceae bacterium]